MSTKRHRLSNVQPSEKRGDCEACGPNVPVKFRRHRNHWACRVGNGSAVNPYQGVSNALPEEEYLTLLAAQGGGCAICGELDGDRRLARDHCHASGDQRGLLCMRCNRGLGLFRDRPDLLQSGIDYLSRVTP